MITVVVLTHNRAHLLRHCVENVLSRTSDATTEIVIWNNGSTDSTVEYLDSLSDPRLTVVHHPENIGQNGYARAFARTSAPYLIELDDDVVEAPHEWDRQLLEAFVRLPKVGFLAATLEDDPHDAASHSLHHVRPHLYSEVVENGVRLLKGPTGGGCAMTSRELYDRVGGFRQSKQVFWLEDAAYIADIERLGYEAAFLADLEVHHTGGPYYSEPSPEKTAYWAAWARRYNRRLAVKRVLLRVPGVQPLNRRLGLFEAPEKAGR